MKLWALGVTFLIIVSISGTIGYFIGSRRVTYRQCRWEIYMASANNAILESEHYERIYRNNDITIFANYYGIQTLPKWLIPVFTIGEERSSEKIITMFADGIEDSLLRSGVTEPREKIERVAREWLAFGEVKTTIYTKSKTVIEQ